MKLKLQGTLHTCTKALFIFIFSFY
jgi:hypothetical protein